MSPKPLRTGQSWFTKTPLDTGLTAFTEPFLHDYFRANFYHLKGRDRDLIVDTGMGLAPIRPEIELLSGKPVLAVATHVHADHVGGLHEFEDRAGARAEADGFASMSDPFTFADEFRELTDPVAALPMMGWSAAEYAIRAAPLTRLLDDGDLIDLGDRCFTVLALPGHSFGCIGLFDETDGVLFSGDAIYDGRLIDDMWCSDRHAYRATMQRLLDLQPRLVHGGHGASLAPDRARMIAQAYLDRC